MISHHYSSHDTIATWHKTLHADISINVCIRAKIEHYRVHTQLSPTPQMILACETNQQHLWQGLISAATLPYKLAI